MTLITGCMENNRDAQREMYTLLSGFAMAICERYAGTQQEAEELAQEGFVKLFRHIHRFDPGRHTDNLSSLKGWFKRILVNTCIDQFRKNRHTAMAQLVPEMMDVPETGRATPVDNLSYKELLAAIRLLSPVYRKVFNLFVLEGMSHEEIASKLGISVGTSKSNLSKAREKMKKILVNLRSINAYV